MHCVKPEQDNFTYYPVNHVSVPVPTLARENCRCAFLQMILRCVIEKNIPVCVIVVVAGWLRCKQFLSRVASELWWWWCKILDMEEDIYVSVVAI